MKAKKIIRIISNVITVFFVVACVFAVIVTISAKKSKDGGFSVFGVQSRIVETQSMEWPKGTTLESFELETDEIKSLSDLKIKDIPLHSMVFISVVPENNAEEWYDVTPSYSWTPIANFLGTFDGGGHTISGLYIKTANDWQGFFGVIDGKANINNLGIPKGVRIIRR
jgi:hypothetical protein